LSKMAVEKGQPPSKNKQQMEGSERLSQRELNSVFLSGLGRAVSRHNGLSSKPLELDLAHPFPLRLRVYLYNATFPPGGRTLGERKIQLIVPGQPRGARGNLDHADGRIVLLVGYESDVDVFILWDAGTYRNFPYSMNVQVNPETVFAAFAGRIAFQTRLRRTPEIINEIVVCVSRERLLEAIPERIKLNLERMLGDEE
jgi:hypothetical protein